MSEQVWPCEKSTHHVHTEGPCCGWPYHKQHHLDLRYLYSEPSS